VASLSQPRERGWLRVLLGLAAFLLVPAVAGLRVLFPIEQTILLVGPAIAVCALVAWVQGGRAWLALTWLSLSAWMLLRPLGDATQFEFLARGWAILLVAIFGILCVIGGRQLFLSRALTTVAATFVFASAVIVVSDVSPMRVQRTVGDELDRRAAPSTVLLEQSVADNPRAAELLEQMLAWWSALPDKTVALFPALLALESLAALALAWGVFHRISRSRIGPPLSGLREFRFGDQLVWGLLAGLVLTVTPSLADLRGLGYNLLLFFGALYLLRGMGVLAWFIGARRLPLVIVALLMIDIVVLDYLDLVFPPATTFLALSLGLGDTWIDWRGRARQPT